MKGINARGYMVMTYLALLAMAALAAYDFVAPHPKSALTPRQQKQSLADTKKNIQALETQLDKAKADVNKYVWNASSDAITSKSLQAITAITANHHVQLVGMRPQKSNSVSGLNQLPYLLLISGAFKDVYAVIRDLEAPSHKLAVSTLQFASADEATDNVNATVTVVAYQVDTSGASK